MMSFKNTRQRAIWMEFDGFIVKLNLWITILLVIICEYFGDIDATGDVGLVLVIKEKKEDTGGRCSDAAIYSQTSWELYETCCQELYPGQTCPLACPCRHGSVCIPSLRQCLCKPGFAGRECNQPCRSRFNDTWGVGCAKPCKCGPDAECDQYLGICTCIDKNSCSRRCGQYRYGPRCEKRCSMCQQLGLECDSNTGQCNLPTFIRDTSNSCGCKNGGTCLPNGKCDCSWGFHGTFCQISCPDNFYGSNCARTCTCGKEAICTPDVGSCRCKDGMGYDCEDRCPLGNFGPKCEDECKCPDGLQCDQKTGDCNAKQDAAKTLSDSLSDLLPKDQPPPPLQISPESPESNVPPSATGRPPQRQVVDTPTTTTASVPSSADVTISSNQAANRQQDVRVANIPSQNILVNEIDQSAKTTPKPITTPVTLPSPHVSKNDSMIFEGEYKNQNGTSGPMEIQYDAPYPPVITTTFYTSNKLWGVLTMIGFLLVILVVLLAILLVKKQTTVPAEADGKLRRLKKLTQEDNIYETVNEIQRNSALPHHPLHIAIFGSPPETPSSPRPMTPTSPRPATPSSPCPGTPLLHAPSSASLPLNQSLQRSDSTKVRHSNDTLPKVPQKTKSMKETSQEGVKMRAKMNAKRPRSIHGLSGIQEGDQANAFAGLNLEQPARFSLLEEIANAGGKKKPFYFVLQADEGTSRDKGYDDIEAYIPGTEADREKTLELAKQGIIYSTVERKRRHRIAQSAKNGNYEHPPDVLPVTKCDRPALVRVDSRKRVVKELCIPVKGDGTDKRSASSDDTDHIYGHLEPTCFSGSRDFLDETYGYDQINRSVPSDPHVIEAEVYSDNIYDQLDRKCGELLIDSNGKMQRQDSKRGRRQPVYDRVQRPEILPSHSMNKIKPTTRDDQYDHVERQDNIFIPISPDINLSQDNAENKCNTLGTQDHVYGELHAVNSVTPPKPKQSSRRDFGTKLLNRFKFSLVKNESNPPRRKNVTYADFWLDFSLKKKVDDYLRATNSLPRTGVELPRSDNDDLTVSEKSETESEDHEVFIEENEMDIDSKEKTDGYESVLENAEEPNVEEECESEVEVTASDMEVNIHCQLQKRYSKIQEHMQNKFQLHNSLSLPASISEKSDRKNEAQYAELRSVENLKTPSDSKTYDQFERTKVAKHMRSASDTAAILVDKKDAIGYQQLSSGTSDKKSHEYDHLERAFGGSRQDLVDDGEGSKDVYGHLVHNDGGKITQPLNKSVSLATEDGWVIVPEKDGKGNEKKRSSEDGKNMSKRLPHQYSNTSMYEEIWPGQQINDG